MSTTVGDMSKSCAGCKFLYAVGIGYSNYTWEESEVLCAFNKNPNLPAERPEDWIMSVDNWDATKESRCNMFKGGQFIHLDVEGDDFPSDYSDDTEQCESIMAHSGRKK